MNLHYTKYFPGDQQQIESNGGKEQRAARRSDDHHHGKRGGRGGGAPRHGREFDRHSGQDHIDGLKKEIAGKGSWGNPLTSEEQAAKDVES